VPFQNKQVAYRDAEEPHRQHGPESIAQSDWLIEFDPNTRRERRIKDYCNSSKPDHLTWQRSKGKEKKEKEEERDLLSVSVVVALNI
jgi:hypothetical protein